MTTETFDEMDARMKAECERDSANMPRAAKIARLITENCDAYHAGTISDEEWDAEQQRLWKAATDAFIARDVMRILFPKEQPDQETRG
jgi:hypothetical protein